MLIPNRVQDKPNSLVLFPAGGVARRSQTAAGMLPPRALPAEKNPARLKLTLDANWNKALRKAVNVFGGSPPDASAGLTHSRDNSGSGRSPTLQGSPDNSLSGFAPVGSGANKKQPEKMA